MFRVITESRDYRGVRVIEAGPWLTSEAEAEKWASILQSLGYVTRIEPMLGKISAGPGDSGHGHRLTDHF